MTRRDVFLRYILAPTCCILGLFGIIELALRFGPINRLIDAYRPAYADIQDTMRVHVEKQLWHVETLAASSQPRVVFIGNSAVVNGIDPAIVSNALTARGLTAQNLGMTGLFAYELPLLARSILTPNTRAVFFFYNTFSFADDFHPDAVDVRWDILEALRLAPLRSSEELLSYLNRAGLQLFASARYRGMFHTMAAQYLSGKLRKLPYSWDYDPQEPPPPPIRPRVMEPPVAASNWVRRSYIDSTELETTLSYRGLARFCELARDNATKLIVGPMPEPDFAAYNRYAQGASKPTVDRKVEAIARRCGATFLPRAPLAEMETQDRLFRDPIHFGTKGREIFSNMISATIGSLL